jgi:hypothetical protein
VQNLFGRTLHHDVDIGRIPYQLLAAAAGTLVEARIRGAVSGVLVVHELIPGARETITASQLSVADFIGVLGRTHAPIPTVGILHGPFAVPGGGLISGETTVRGARA